jgi:hypothetical protein
MARHRLVPGRGGFEQREASGTPRPAASLSSTTAVGLVSARSIRDSIERLTPHWLDSASSDRPRSARSCRTRWAMRSLREVSSFIMETIFHHIGYIVNMLDYVSTMLEKRQ